MKACSLNSSLEEVDVEVIIDFWWEEERVLYQM